MKFIITEHFGQGAEFRSGRLHLRHRELKPAIAYLKLSKEVEARNNARLLRPFFKKIFKRRKHNATKK